MTITFLISKVKELMTSQPALISPTATLQQAAEKMAKANCGALPVGTTDQLRGIITDRDIVIRAIAKGKDPAEAKVANFMTEPVYTCLETDTVEDAATKMHEYKVSRLVVKNKEGKITGILSFGTIFRNDVSAQEVASIVKRAAGPVSV